MIQKDYVSLFTPHMRHVNGLGAKLLLKYTVWFGAVVWACVVSSYPTKSSDWRKALAEWMTDGEHVLFDYQYYIQIRRCPLVSSLRNPIVNVDDDLRA